MYYITVYYILIVVALLLYNIILPQKGIEIRAKMFENYC